jgi:hypothetical protein
MMAANPAAPAPASRTKLGGFAGFALATSALVLVAGFGLALFFRTPADRTAIAISAALALITQLSVFPAVRRLTAANLMVGWGLGSLVRFGTLLVYALVGAFVLHLSMTPALVSLALFYFLSMVIEPLFLRS